MNAGKHIVEKGTSFVFSTTYLRPIAHHRDATERLLLKDEAGAWFLWHGDGSELIDVSDQLAGWILTRPEMVALSGPVMWFAPSSLPVAPHHH